MGILISALNDIIGGYAVVGGDGDRNMLVKIQVKTLFFNVVTWTSVIYICMLPQKNKKKTSP